MNETENLALLRNRAVKVQLCEQRVDKLYDLEGGELGMFLPRCLVRKDNIILLRSGRTALQTLITLCHELGHFWAYATKRRTVLYDRALQKYNQWWSSIETVAHNDAVVMKYENWSKVPEEIRLKALGDAKRERPIPLTEDERREILAEEARAWCFGFEVAKGLGVEAGAFVAERNAGLRVYSSQLDLPRIDSVTINCTCNLDDVDQNYIRDLTVIDSDQAD